MYEDRYIYNISPKVFALMMVVFLLTVVDFTVTRYGVAQELLQICPDRAGLQMSASKNTKCKG